MAAFNKFNCFVEDLAEKQHNLRADTLKMHLTNPAPSATDTAHSRTCGRSSESRVTRRAGSGARGALSSGSLLKDACTSEG